MLTGDRGGGEVAKSTVLRVGILARNSKIQIFLRPSAAITWGTLIHLRPLRGRGSFYLVLVRADREGGMHVLGWLISLCRFYRRFLNCRISVENGRPVANFISFCSPEDGLSLCYAWYSNYCIRDGEKYF